MGVDETSHGRGHGYITVFADLECSKVLFATGGRDSSTIERCNYIAMIYMTAGKLNFELPT